MIGVVADSADQRSEEHGTDGVRALLGIYAVDAFVSGAQYPGERCADSGDAEDDLEYRPEVAIPELKSMDEQVDESVATDRFRRWC